MDVFRYIVNVYASSFDVSHRRTQAQTRIYIPGQLLLGYRAEGQFDFVEVDRASLEAELDKPGLKAATPIDLPKEEVDALVSASKIYIAAQRTLTDLTRELEK